MKLVLGPEWVRFRRADLRIEIDPRVGPSGEEIRRSTFVLAAGWNVDCLETRGEIEHQIRARYRILDATPVLMIAGPRDQIAAHRDELDAIIRSATFEPTTPACLADLFVDVAD
jgi:hypothetical protein